MDMAMDMVTVTVAPSPMSRPRNLTTVDTMVVMDMVTDTVTVTVAPLPMSKVRNLTTVDTMVDTDTVTVTAAPSPMMSRDRNTTTETTTVDIIPVMVDTATDTTTIKPIHFSFLNTESIFLVRKLLPSTEHFHQTA